MSSTSRRRNKNMGNSIRYRNVQNGRRQHVACIYRTLRMKKGPQNIGCLK
jgi:hypothetical protein